jgi:hypothetical protein
VEPTRSALLARATGRDDAEADVVSGRDVGYGVADRLHDASAFVAEDDRPASVAELAVREPHVGVADAGSCDANQDLVGTRRSELDLLEDERLPRLVEDGRADAHQPMR